MTTHASVSQRDALDIVFANRNRAYGAYQLRREYPVNLARALGFGVLLIALALLAPRILAAFSSLTPEKQLVEVVAEPRDIIIEKLVPPPPVLTVPSPPKASIAFTPPVVAPDEQAPNETPPDVQTLLDDPRSIGSTNVEGPSDAPPSLDPPTTGLGIIDAPKPTDDGPVEAFAVHKMPSFPGGEAEMFKWISQNMSYPQMAREAGTEGLVVLSFVVGKDGNISDIAVLKTPAGGNVLGTEATRVVKSMPRWSPGEANGHPVKVRFTLPIRFAIK